MIEEFIILIFRDLLWIPQILLFLAGNLSWKPKDENKLSLVWQKGDKQYREVPKKTKIYICLGIALIWLMLAQGYYSEINPLIWILFSINQSIWIVARAKYFRFLKKHLIILETPEIRSQNSKEKLFLGKINSPKLFTHKFFLNLNDLRKHMFVCGLTGMGKSNFIQFFLTKFYEKFYQIPFLIIEFKGEYQGLKDFIPDIQYIHPGESFSLNIFDPLDSDPDVHAERLFDILRSCDYVQESSEFSPQMEKVLVDILKTVCQEPEKRKFNSFEKEIELYRAKFKNQIPMLEQTIISITNRLRRIFSGPLKAVFSQMGTFTINDLFSKRVCLDLSSIIRLGGEKRDALFFLNMIFKYLWDRNISRGSTDKPCHMCVLEDAQYMIPHALLKQSKLSTYIEDVSLLQRGTGEILISIATRPAVSEDVLANAGVFLTFQSHYDTSQIQELLGLKNDQVKLIGTLQEGECLIRVASVPRPFSLKIPLLKKKHHILKTIQQQHTQIISSANSRVPVRKDLKRTLVCYFHNIRGPQVLSFSKLIPEESHTQRILGNLEKGEGFCELSFNEWNYLLYVFEVVSKWGRGNVELFMIGIKIKPQEKRSEDFKTQISKFVEKVKQNLNLFKICYYDRLNEEFYQDYSEEIRKEYYKFQDAIYELEENLFSPQKSTLPKDQMRLPIRVKLNPAQLAALNEFNEFVEQLLSKEK